VSSLDALLIWLNSGVCSQNPAHSFWVDGRPLPLCARDLGLFGGFLLASLLPARRQLWWLLALAPLLIDGANSFTYDTVGLSLYAPTNTLRLLTGMLAGITLSGLIGHVRVTRAILALGLVAMVSPYFALALLATAGVLAMLAAANKLARANMRLAWALALPELALLATAKQGLLTLLS